MAQDFDFDHPTPVAQFITHVGDGQQHTVRIARHASDVEPAGIRPDTEIDVVVAWDAVCAGVGSDPESGSNIFVSLPDDALQQFSDIAGNGAVGRLRIRPLAGDQDRSVIEIAGDGVSAAVVVTTITLQAATATPKRILLTLPGTSPRGNAFGLIGEALRAAARNMAHNPSGAEDETSAVGPPSEAFGDVQAAFALPS